MLNTNFNVPIVVEKRENEWVCQLSDGRTITLQFELAESSDEPDYADETIQITFWEGDDVLGNGEDFFEFSRNGYIIAIERQSYLFRNIFIPKCLRGTGISQLAIEFFKDCTNDADIHVQNPFGIKVDDGSQLLEPGQRFVQRMQGIGLIKSFID
jgi:hypothetical protein